MHGEVMMADVEERLLSSVATQTEYVSSPILWQCLYVIKTVSEFQNLSYRVTRTHSNLEVLMVYREGACGIFGPPLDPMTLTLDPSGRCLVNILFKTVQRVNFVAKASGCIEIASLMAVLRLIAGRGYLFCPGIPEKFLAGKACGKHVMVHRIPFKRYQSNQCPVYYQVPPSHTTGKSSLCSLCPSCLQTAKIVVSLPFLPVPASKVAPPVTQPIKQSQAVVSGCEENKEERNANVNNSNSDCMIVSVEKMPTTVSAAGPDTLASQRKESLVVPTGVILGPPKTQVITTQFGKTTVVRHLPVEELVASLPSNPDGSDQRRAQSAPVGAGQTVSQQQEEKKEGPVNSHLLQLLREKGAQKSNVEGQSMASGRKLKRETARNVCRICHKHFSSDANLLNHIQRHEGLSVSGRHNVRQGRNPSKNNNTLSATILSRILRRSCSRVQDQRKGVPPHLSGMSMRLIQKCVSDMMPLLGPDAKKGTPNSLSKRRSKRVHSQTNGSKRNTPETKERPGVGLKRSSSGLSAMQTLLEAAAIASKSPDICILPSSSSDSKEKSLDIPPIVTAPNISTGPPLPATVTLPDELNPPSSPKRARKSSRLASKLAKEKKKESKKGNKVEEVSVNISQHNAVNLSQHNTLNMSQNNADTSMLTNLNLLSTVSLETARRDSSSNPLSQETLASGTTAAPVATFSPRVTFGSTFPVLRGGGAPPLATSQPPKTMFTQSASCVAGPTISLNQLMSMAGGNVKVREKSVVTGPPFPIINKSGNNNPNTANLPPLPPLLFAGNIPPHPIQTFPATSSLVPNAVPKPITLSTDFANSSPVALAQIRNSVVSSHPEETSHSAADSVDAVTAGAKVAASDCGAIDLSKPKPLQLASDIPLLAASRLAPEAVGAQKSLPQSVEQFLFLMNKNPGKEDGANSSSVPPQKLTNDKHADSSLQARMFASARDYKLKAPRESCSSHVQAVIASTTRQAGGQGKAGNPATALTSDGGSGGDEIQCGYKWSGSGGLVKERTQRTRELVPPAIMANYLSGHNPHQTSTVVTKSQSSGVMGQSPRTVTVNASAGGMGRGAPQLPYGLQHSSHTNPTTTTITRVDLPTVLPMEQPRNPSPHMVLNLSTARATGDGLSSSSPRKRTPGRSGRLAAANAASTLSMVPTPRPPVAPPVVSPSSTSPRGLLRTTLMNPRSMVTQLLSSRPLQGGNPVPVSPTEINTQQQPQQLQQQQQQALNLAQLSPSATSANFFSLPPSPAPTNTSSSSSSSVRAISSPSLAAILRQPVSVSEASSEDFGSRGASVVNPSSTFHVTANEDPSSSTRVPPNAVVSVKEEPRDVAPYVKQLQNQPRIIMSLPLVKKERPDLEYDKAKSQSSRDSSPALVMDISTDGDNTVGKTSMDDLVPTVVVQELRGKLSTVDNVKCEFCKTTFHHSQNHTCSQRMQSALD